jgi:MoaA/NifB/PqqE/SkfB family radical SAM enzyme
VTSPLPELVNHIVTGSPAISDLELDGTKVMWWRDRIEKWRRSEKFAPITMDVAWTRQCNAACSFCYAQMQANDDGQITKKHAFEFLEDAAEIGVKGVSLISDGESTVVPWYEESIEYGAKVGLKIGVGTNGVRLRKRVLERILPHLSYLRFNFSAGDVERYKQIMGLKQRDYWQVIQNVRDAMDIVNRDKLPVTVNLQMVTMPEMHDQILPLARLAKEIRPHYLIYKHCADNVDGYLGIDYRKYDALFDTFREAEAMSDDGFRVVVKWSRLADEGKRDYQRCFGPPFILQMSGSGLIAPCGFMFNSRYQKFHVGNITRTRFRELYESDRYWEVMRYLGSDEFNAQKACGPNCLQTNTNSWLDKFMKGTVQLPPVGATAPAHLEFL